MSVKEEEELACVLNDSSAISFSFKQPKENCLTMKKKKTRDNVVVRSPNLAS